MPALVDVFVIFMMMSLSGITIGKLRRIGGSYDPSRPPPKGFYNSAALKVYVQVQAPDYIDQRYDGKDFLVNLNITTRWTDSRLQYILNYTDWTDEENIIWSPEFILLNEQTYGRSKPYITAFPNGTVTITRNFNLKCSATITALSSTLIRIRMLSKKYAVGSVEYIWEENRPVTLSEVENDYFYKRMKILNFTTRTCESNGIAGLVDALEKYGCLDLQMVIKKGQFSTLFEIYMPSSVTVILSWTPFWMKMEANLGRALIPVVAIVHLLNLKFIIIKEVTVAELAIVVNIWVYNCIMLAACALIEVLLVNFLYRCSTTGHERLPNLETATMQLIREEKDDSESISEGYQQGHSPATSGHDTFLKRCFPCYSNSMANVVNSTARWAFPTIFIAVCIIFRAAEKE